MSIYNLVKLYDTPVEGIDGLSESKYGVTYYCPEDGTYAYEPERDQVQCSMHGNRQSSRQDSGMSPEASFSKFVESLDEVVASLRFLDDSLIATVELKRR